MPSDETNLVPFEALDIVYNSLMLEPGAKEHVLSVVKEELKFQLDKGQDVAFAPTAAEEGVAVQLQRWLKDSMPAVGSFWGELLQRAFDMVDFTEFAERAIKEVELHIILIDGATAPEKVFFSLAEAKAALREILVQSGDPDLEEVLGALCSGDGFEVGGVSYVYMRAE